MEYRNLGRSGLKVSTLCLISAAVAGPRTEAQWDEYLGNTDYAFSAEDEALIDRLVVTGHPSTPGYSDPAYPIEGRVAR